MRWPDEKLAEDSSGKNKDKKSVSKISTTLKSVQWTSPSEIIEIEWTVCVAGPANGAHTTGRPRVNQIGETRKNDR